MMTLGLVSKGEQCEIVEVRHCGGDCRDDKHKQEQAHGNRQQNATRTEEIGLRVGFTPLSSVAFMAFVLLHALHDRAGRHASGVRYLEMCWSRIRLPDLAGLDGGNDHLSGRGSVGTRRIA